MTGKQYQMSELKFKAPGPEGSFVQVNLMAEIRNASSVVNVKGFYAGNGTYKIRFLPETAGTYNIKISGVVNQDIDFEVLPADDSHHGIVRADGTHLKYSDGTFFYSFGTTVYALANQNNKLAEETMETLNASPFNKLRTCVFPKNYEYNKNEPEYFAFQRDNMSEYIQFISNSGEKIEVKPFNVHRPDFRFWDGFESKLQRIMDMGIQVDLILFHPYDRWGHSHMGQENNLVYIDYLIRRFAAYPGIWWSIANEYDLFTDWDTGMWHGIDEYISVNDPYHHMVSNHNCFIPYDFGRSTITHVSLQSRAMSRVAELQREFNKPVFYDECCYEGNLKETWGSISAKEMVNRFWKVTTTGGYCTHGEVLLDRNIKDRDNAVMWWSKGGKLHGSSPERIRFLREIIEELPAPLDPFPVGINRMLAMPGEEINMIMEVVPEELRHTMKLFMNMSGKELLYHIIPEMDYAGHIGEEVFLYYYAENCCSYVLLDLPEGKTFTVEVIDAWNMVRETVTTDAEAGAEIILPGHEYIAVLAKANT